MPLCRPRRSNSFVFSILSACRYAATCIISTALKMNMWIPDGGRRVFDAGFLLANIKMLGINYGSRHNISCIIPPTKHAIPTVHRKCDELVLPFLDEVVYLPRRGPTRSSASRQPIPLDQAPDLQDLLPHAIAHLTDSYILWRLYQSCSPCGVCRNRSSQGHPYPPRLESSESTHFYIQHPRKACRALWQDDLTKINLPPSRVQT